jgi:hypothetical protein
MIDHELREDEGVDSSAVGALPALACSSILACSVPMSEDMNCICNFQSGCFLMKSTKSF